MIVNGGTVVMLPKFTPERLLEYVQKFGATFMRLVPTMRVRLRKLDEDVRRSFDVSSLQSVVHDAGLCPVDIKRAFIEGHGHTAITPAQWLANPGSAGKAGPGFVFRVCDEDGHQVPTGELGLVYFESGTSSADFGYHRSDESASSSRHPFQEN